MSLGAPREALDVGLPLLPTKLQPDRLSSEICSGVMKMTAILVSGVRGKTGRQLCAALLHRKGVEVLGAARSLAGPSIPGVTLRHFDWQNPKTWPKALAGIEAIYLLRPKTNDPAGTIASLLQSAEMQSR